MSPARRTRASESGSVGLRPVPTFCCHAVTTSASRPVPQCPVCKGELSVPSLWGFTQDVCAAGAREPAAGRSVFVLTSVSVAGKPLVQGLSPFRPEVAVGFHLQPPVRGCSFPRSQSISLREGLGLAGLRHIPAPDQGSLTRPSCHCAAGGESDGTPTVLSRGGIPPRSGLNGPVASVCRMD